MTENNATDPSTPYEAEELAGYAASRNEPAEGGYDAAALAARYGIKPGMSRARKITLGIVGFALLCGVGGYIAWNQAHPQIQGTVIRYSVDDQSIQVTFEVDKSASQSVMCTIQAEDIQGNVIGSANVSVPGGPSGRAVEDMVYTVNTTGTPNTAVVSSCNAIG
jgi:hypothetical protein